jgi:hypothetical protein
MLTTILAMIGLILAIVEVNKHISLELKMILNYVFSKNQRSSIILTAQLRQ